jgi:hypothetical protein
MVSQQEKEGIRDYKRKIRRYIEIIGASVFLPLLLSRDFCAYVQTTREAKVVERHIT